jgi:NAD(P)-dependent dehydrogenase (short-subunit alcohol dehydrogenase family)
VIGLLFSGVTAMAYSVKFEQFKFAEKDSETFAGKRVLITGSGKDGGVGQALALAAAANGAEVVGIYSHSSYRDGFDLVVAIWAQGVKAFAMQDDVTNTHDLWASRI